VGILMQTFKNRVIGCHRTKNYLEFVHPGYGIDDRKSFSFSIASAFRLISLFAVLSRKGVAVTHCIGTVAVRYRWE